MGDGAIRVAHVMHGLMMGGLEQVVVRLCDAGRRFGVEPRVIAMGHDGAVRDLLAKLDIPVTYLGPVRGMTPPAVGGIARALREHRIDVAHAHDLGPWLNAVTAKTLAPWVRNVVTFHQIHLPTGLQRVSASAAAMMSDALVACGGEVRSCVARWAPPRARLELVGNGVPIGPEPSAEARNEARQRMGVPQDAIVLGYLGRLHAEKGVDLLVDAFLESFARRENVHLVLIGKGHLGDELKARVDEAGCGRVHFLGEVLAASSLLSGLDIYVQPSRREGRSLSMLEAMAAGLPTVAQALPAISEIHVQNETALLVAPGPKPPFAAQIARLIDDADLRTRMGQHARAHVKRYSVDAMAEEYARLYRDLAARRGWTRVPRALLQREAA